MSLNTPPPIPTTIDSPPSPNAIWTPIRIELRAWLQRNAPSLGELYEGSVYLMFDTPLSGRVRFIAHAVREIRNRLPDTISGIKGGGTLSYKNKLDDIVKSWQKAGFALDGSLPTSQVSIDEPASVIPDIKVPRSLFIQIAKLIRDHENVRSKPIETATRLFESLAPENQLLRDTLRPVILQWLEITDWGAFLRFGISTSRNVGGVGEGRKAAAEPWPLGRSQPDIPSLRHRLVVSTPLGGCTFWSHAVQCIESTDGWSRMCSSQFYTISKPKFVRSTM